MPLTPSQRVTLIKEIGERLGKESWSLVDITLQQFGVRTADEWNGTLEGYVLRMVQDAPALATCEALVALLHDKFHASNWTDQEIGFAMGRGVPAFAVRLGETPYGFIGRFQAFNGAGKTPSDLAREIFDAFRKNKQTQRKMSEVIVALFEDSYSFAEAAKRMGFLEALEVWDPSFPARLRAAVQANNQISGSWGVPQRVEKLIAKWVPAVD